MNIDKDLAIETDDEVYPPSDDSYLLIESLEMRPKEKVLEIGCGSGIVSIHCAKNGALVTCGDVNSKAVTLTKKNAALNNIRLDVRETDVYSRISEVFDTIIFNLPYLPVNDEGLLAVSWSGGDDGMGPLPELLDYAPYHLEDGGRVVIVVSSLMDGDRMNAFLSAYNVSILGELPLFFEKLRVLEIKLRR
ncbi:MAG: methyltransferase [Candidatus Methanoplasma sp.]|jgi:release factor glutamine methyltransferase|nr:methyltransferase [Candidatus Methanoplasma sp.]